MQNNFIKAPAFRDIQQEIVNQAAKDGPNYRAIL